VLHEPPARDDQRVVARRVHRRRREVGRHREPVARELRVELRAAGVREDGWMDGVGWLLVRSSTYVT
jgi:hypothetical protein